MRICFCVLAMTVAFLLASPAFAGKLGDFEKDVSKERKTTGKEDKGKTERKRKHGRRCLDSCLDSFLDSCMLFVIDSLFGDNEDDYDYDLPSERARAREDAAAEYPDVRKTTEPAVEIEEQSNHRYHLVIPEITTENDTGGQAGELPPVPDDAQTKDVVEEKLPEPPPQEKEEQDAKFFLRIDAAYQDVETDVRALDFLGEAGYGGLGILLRDSEYFEDDPSDELTIAYALAIIRLSIEDILIIGGGAGGVIVDGDSAQSGYSFTLPVRIRPIRYFSLEFLGIWSSVNDNPIKDYDIGAVAGHENISAKAGYRWVMTENESLNGPYAGITVRF